MQNRAEPGTATTVVNCYKRELELISDLTNRNNDQARAFLLGILVRL